ncbi:hypothetical protein CYMTET_30426 [Cymbomonas tetramitiformis]|uniref:Uncharacterized protein n=1 Tax=Cymbomonas tetramitiformis TaxID=36881 RepID=A0AAE0KTY4_9CHLO|nr:hypothetical protein CYMTET_30426 [Cymbomonas tetramitiformis]
MLESGALSDGACTPYKDIREPVPWIGQAEERAHAMEQQHAIAASEAAQATDILQRAEYSASALAKEVHARDEQMLVMAQRQAALMERTDAEIKAREGLAEETRSFQTLVEGSEHVIARMHQEHHQAENAQAELLAKVQSMERELEETRGERDECLSMATRADSLLQKMISSSEGQSGQAASAAMSHAATLDDVVTTLGRSSADLTLRDAAPAAPEAPLKVAHAAVLGPKPEPVGALPGQMQHAPPMHGKPPLYRPPLQQNLRR